MALVNEYTFGEMTGTSLIDSIGTNNGTFGGATLPTWTRSLDLSKVRTQLDFTGGNGATVGNRQRVELTRTPFEYSSSSNFSLVCIFKSTKNDATAHNLFSLDDQASNASQLRFDIHVNEGAYIRVLNNNTAYKLINPSLNVCDGKWHMVVATYASNKTLKLYIDGVDMGASTDVGTLSGNFFTANCKATIGACWSQTANNYVYDLNGSIAYFANYNHTLSAAEVQRITEEQLYKVYSRDSGATYRYLPPRNANRDGLLGWYPMNGGSSDISGNAKNGVDTSMNYATLDNSGSAIATFNGTSSKITISNLFPSSTDAITLAYWINPTATNATYVIFEQATTSSNFLNLIWQASVAYHRMYTTGYILTCQTATLAGWHHYIYTWSTSQGNAKLYIDGKLAVTSSDSRSTSMSFNTDYIFGGRTSSWYSGKMRDVRLYNKLLDATEADKLYRDTFIN